jgi:hypothetical protein
MFGSINDEVVGTNVHRKCHLKIRESPYQMGIAVTAHEDYPFMKALS